MSATRCFATVLLLIAMVPSAWAQPCSYTMGIDVVLNAFQSTTVSEELSGDLTSVSINLDFAGPGASYPSDMMIYVYAPNGNCVVWGGWTGNPVGGCTNLGTGLGGAWPGSWNTSADGNFTASLNLNAYGLDGAGTWSVQIQNAWGSSGPVSYDMDITFSGICQGDCFDIDACNFNPEATIVYNDLCEYAIDLYPSGYYDCNGDCYYDFDGDLICNELEVPGCQEPYACNYNPAATDPPLAGQPCVYPEDDDVDCDGNSLLPVFLTQPSNATVSCSSIPVAPFIAAQPSSYAVAYHSLFPQSCYDAGEDVDIQFQETEIPGSCPGNYTLQRYWVITDCMGLQNSMLQTITVVDNLPPVVLTNLEPDTLDCNDVVWFEPLTYEDACGGAVTLVEDPSYVTLPGTCDGNLTEKKFTTLTDECGNTTTVQQVLLIVDSDPPFWLEETVLTETITTDDLGGVEFPMPEADDVCSDFEVNMTVTVSDGDCPLSEVWTRTFVAIDQCGNTSAPFVQTIVEETDLEADLSSTSVTCHDGNNGTATLTYGGGVAPYLVDWGGYNPEALPAGIYTVEVTDANLCSVDTTFTITEPSAFTLELESTVPDCNDPNSGTITADANGGTGNVTLDWGGISPTAVMAGSYTVTATDASGCQATASVVVPPADIPAPLELDGNTFVQQGESAPYYYEFTLGSTYEWTYTGATPEEVGNTFAISVIWQEPDTQQVCVVETNLDGCVGNPVCLDVYVQDDVWAVGEADANKPSITAFPNPSSGLFALSMSGGQEASVRCELLDSRGKVVKVWTAPSLGTSFLDCSDLPSGTYLLSLKNGSKPLTLAVEK